MASGRSPRRLWSVLGIAAAVVLVSGALLLVSRVAGAGDEVRFAVIGDYGDPGRNAAAVAALVHGWNVDLILSVGDNNYERGQAETIDQNVGQHYSRYIAPYRGGYGSGGRTNRFFPVPGDHDWEAPGLKPYLDYFELPGNERYYTFAWGHVRFFAVDSDEREPDGATANSVQGRWLREQLAASDACWNVVYLHHTPYASGTNRGTERMRWPFKEWGAHVVFGGHDHIYERVEQDGMTYLTVGLGGRGRYELSEPLPGTIERWNAGYGAMRVNARPDRMRLEFVAVGGGVVDRFELTRDCEHAAVLPVVGRLGSGWPGG